LSLATVALWLACLLVTATFLSLINTLGVSGTFFLYAFISMLAYLFILRTVPETKGRTLEEIETQWR
jgi:hypothetical protein